MTSAAPNAQAALFPGGAGPARTAAPHWRASVSGGLSGALTGVATVGLERTLAGPFSAGGRGLLYTWGGFVDDGGSVAGVGAEALTSVATRDRIVDLRAFAGAGASAVRVYGGGLVDVASASAGASGRAVRPFLVGGVGLDVYPFAGVGVGVEARGVLDAHGGELSTVALGLRLRLAR